MLCTAVFSLGWPPAGRGGGAAAPGPHGELHEIGQTLRVGLGHDEGAVGLDGAVADAEFLGDLLVGQSVDKEHHHLALTVGQLGNAHLHRSGRFTSGLLLAPLGERLGDALIEARVIKGLLYEVEGSPLDREDGHIDVAMPGDQDDRQGAAALGQLALEVETRDAIEPHVRNDAATCRRGESAQELVGGAQHAGLVATPLEQHPDGVADRVLIIYDEHCRLTRHDMSHPLSVWI